MELSVTWPAVALSAVLPLWIIALLFYEPICIWLMVREIRKQATLLPEDRREAYLREAMAGIEDPMSDDGEVEG